MRSFLERSSSRTLARCPSGSSCSGRSGSGGCPGSPATSGRLLQEERFGSDSYTPISQANDQTMEGSLIVIDAQSAWLSRVRINS